MSEKHCMFYHPKNSEERNAIIDRMEYFRSIGDTHGVTICLVQVTACNCGYNPKDSIND